MYRLIPTFIFVLASKCISITMAVQLTGSGQEHVEPRLILPEIQDIKPTPTIKEVDENSNDDDFVYGLVEPDRFDGTLIKRVASTFSENFLISPVGLKLVLSLLQEGAVRETQAELKALFREDFNRTDMRMKYSNITELLRKKSPENIAYLSSWIFISTDTVSARYKAVGNYFYNIETTVVHTESPTQTVNEINSKISNATLGNILNPVNEDDVINMSMLVLNTLYFEGRWHYPFSISNTKLREFLVSPTSVLIIPFMTITNEFYYAESTKFDAKILRIPYESSRFAMYFIVPNSLTGLSYVVENIKLMPRELQLLQRHNVEVVIPKFKFTYTSHLETTLKEMDLEVAFDERASFPGIARGQSNRKRLKLSKVIQRCLIQVNENGSGVFLTPGMSVANDSNKDARTLKEVLANRPFFFFIQDDGTSQLLAFGSVLDPTLTEGLDLNYKYRVRYKD